MRLAYKAICRALAIIALCILSGCVLASSRPKEAHTKSTTIPTEYLALYEDLDRSLSDGEELLRNANRREYPTPSKALHLFMADSFWGATDVGSSRWRQILDSLDGFQYLGVSCVLVTISFPDLTLEVQEPEPLLKFYDALSREVHSRGMTLLVEHFVNPPISSTPQGRFVAAVKETNEPKKSFLKWMTSETSLIIQRIKPDYFSILTEPDTLSHFLGFSISTTEYTEWLSQLTSQWVASGIKGNTKLGAGGGVWEAPDFFLSLAEVKDLDYVDFHIYPMTLGQQKMMPRFQEMIEGVRKIDPKKQLIIGEAWLYKQGSNEGGGVLNPKSFARNSLAFWSPLDIRFLQLLFDFGSAHGITIIEPYFGQFFFDGTQLGSGASLPPWPASTYGEWLKALESAKSKSLSPLGLMFRSI